MKRENNFFTYDVSGNGYVKGKFNIYQSISGSIVLCMGNGFIILSRKQIDELHINIYDLIDFDYKTFGKYYNL